MPVAWHVRLTGNSILGMMPSRAGGVDRHFQEGFLEDMPYDIPNYLADYAMRDDPRAGRVLALRESHPELLLQGELHRRNGACGRTGPLPVSAPDARQSPARRQIPRACSTPPPSAPAGEGRRRDGVYRGIALNEVQRHLHAPRSSRSRSATTAAARASRGQRHRLRHVVNPLTVEMQVESATVDALTAALYGEITIKDGRVEQSNFHDYRMLRLAEMPKVETVHPAERRLLGRRRRTPRCGRRAGVVQCDLRGDRQAHPLAAAQEPRFEESVEQSRRPIRRRAAFCGGCSDMNQSHASSPLPRPARFWLIGPASAAGPADAPPGAAACSGCHPATARWIRRARG